MSTGPMNESGHHMGARGLREELLRSSSPQMLRRMGLRNELTSTISLGLKNGRNTKIRSFQEGVGMQVVEKICSL